MTNLKKSGVATMERNRLDYNRYGFCFVEHFFTQYQKEYWCGEPNIQRDLWRGWQRHSPTHDKDLYLLGPPIYTIKTVERIYTPYDVVEYVISVKADWVGPRGDSDV